MDSGAEGAKRVWRRRVGRRAAEGRPLSPGCPDSGDCAGSSCRASQALSSAPAAARPTAPGNTLGRMWWRASRHAAASMPSTTADASSQPRTGAPRSRATSTPSPRARSRAPTMRAKRRVPPRTRHGRSLCGPRTPAPGATPRRWRSSRPPSRPPGPFPPSTGSYEISGRLRHDRLIPRGGLAQRRDTPEAWGIRTDADEAAPAVCSTR